MRLGGQSLLSSKDYNYQWDHYERQKKALDKDSFLFIKSILKVIICKNAMQRPHVHGVRTSHCVQMAIHKILGKA